MTAMATADPSLFGAGRGRLTVGICLIMSAVAFELLGAATALPAAVDDIGGLSLYGWAVAMPLISGALAIPVGGRLADRYGLAVPTLLALTWFAIGLIGVAVAPSMGAVVGARFVQGAGSGMLLALQLGIVARAYTGARRGAMLALLSTVWIVPGLVGPGIAGFVAEHFGWRWVFAGVVPLLIVTALLVVPALPKGRAISPAGDGGTAAWWHQPGTRSAIATGLLVSLAFLSVEAFLPLVLTRMKGFSFAAAGLPLTVSSVMWALGAWLQARTRPSQWRATASIGALLIAAGVGATSSVLFDAVPGWVAYFTWGVAAFGMGLVFTIVQHAAIDAAPVGREARVGAAVELANTIGVAAGTGLAAILFAREAGSLQTRFAIVFGCCAAAALTASITARRLPLVTAPRPTQPDSTRASAVRSS